MNEEETPSLVTELMLRKRLSARYAAPEYALFHEVPDGTGSHKSRTIDALAMSLYPSRGLYLHGFEIKSSRSDFQKEMKDPEKAEAVARYCDFFFLVAAPNICTASEVPATWGLIEAYGTGLRISKPAVPMKPLAIGRTFLAALCRRATEIPPVLREVLRSETADSERARLERELERVRSERDSLRDQVEGMNARAREIDRITGLNTVYERDLKGLGAAVNLLRSVDLTSSMRRQVNAAREFAERQERSLADLKANTERIEREFCPPATDPDPLS